MPEPIAREALDRVIERIAYEKKSAASACEGICSPAYFFRELTRNPALVEQYERARTIRADARFEAIDEIVEAVGNGILDPNAARVMIDTIKWQCGKERPKRYSDKIDIKAEVVVKSPRDMSVAELREWASELESAGNGDAAGPAELAISGLIDAVAEEITDEDESPPYPTEG